ncbi:Fe-S cluster assembly protein SufD [candidate division KSB1 bacterium]|nr:Fe-S cluster assembly protein SufD [candidate division KSB1 bacterium]
MKRQLSTEREWYSQLFTEFERSLNGESKTPLHAIRKEAIDWFSDHGFPTMRQEEWRFTNVSAIGEIDFKTGIPKVEDIAPTDLSPYVINNDYNRLVFVDGCFFAGLSRTENLPDGVTVKSLQEAMLTDQEVIQKNLTKHAKIDENGFVALNTAFFKDGAFIHVSKNSLYEQPIHLIYLMTEKSKESVVFPRNLIVAEQNSQISFIENYISLSDTLYFMNPVTEVVAGENAVVHHYKIQQDSLNAFHTSLMQVYQERSSNYTSHNYAFGGSIVRNDIKTMLDGEGIECTLNGLYLARGTQLIDNHSVIEHAKPHCNSRELYKGILDNQARAVFSGKIQVFPDAQKTDAIQSNQNLILSEEATVDTKPQLEIYADDVKCTHGGTVGQINKDGIFYLRARGISADMAKNLMIQAFAGEVTDRLKGESLKEHIVTFVLSQLADGHLKIMHLP